MQKDFFMEKKEEYKRIKLIGYALFIPFILVGGPIVGYFAGSFLQARFYPNIQLALILTLVGLAASTFETIRMIRLMIKTEKGHK